MIQLSFRNLIIIAQVHTHPLIEGSKKNNFVSETSSGSTFTFVEGETNGPGVSPVDRNAAIELNTPVYAIQAYNGLGNIFKTDQGGNLNTKSREYSIFKSEEQIPVGNISNLGTNQGEFNIIFDAFRTRNNFKL